MEWYYNKFGYIWGMVTLMVARIGITLILNKEVNK